MKQRLRRFLAFHQPWYLRWWFWTPLIILTILIPVIINCAYMSKNPKIFTHWTASDTLSFYGAYLAFLGTIALGALALNQNKRITVLEEEKYKLDLRPFVIVSNWEVKYEDILDVYFPQKIYIDIEGIKFDQQNYFCFSVYLTNSTNSFLTVEYSGADVYENDHKTTTWKNTMVNIQNYKIYLNAGNTGQLVFYCYRGFFNQFEGKRIALQLILENRIGERYNESLNLFINRIFDNQDHCIINLVAQDYDVRKYTKKRDGTIQLEQSIQ